jgi:hypothetical protein
LTLPYLQITNPCLKVELQRKLDLPPSLTGRGGNLAERGSAEDTPGGSNAVAFRKLKNSARNWKDLFSFTTHCVLMDESQLRKPCE